MKIEQNIKYSLFIKDITIRSDHARGGSGFEQLKEERSLEILVKSDKKELDEPLYKGKREGDVCTIHTVNYSAGDNYVRITFDEYVELRRPKEIQVVEKRTIAGIN